jgi:hypothetical protein
MSGWVLVLPMLGKTSAQVKQAVLAYVQRKESVIPCNGWLHLLFFCVMIRMNERKKNVLVD